MKKQWLGFLLISKLFDPTICKVDDSIMGKNINIFLQQISNTISKNDLLSDICIVSINAWHSLLATMAQTYEPKLY